MKIKHIKKRVRRHRPRSWQAAHLSVTGDKHVRDGTPGQDYGYSRVFDDGAWACVVVADGHGSGRHFRSDRGAQLAVEAMRDVVRSFSREVRGADVADVQAMTGLWAKATRDLVRSWREKIHADLVSDPARIPGKTGGEPGFVKYLDDFAKRNGYAHLEQLFWQLRRFEDEYAKERQARAPEDLGPLPHFHDDGWDQAKYGGWQAKAYGTTLLGVLMGPASLHWVQVGDGAMVQVVDGQASYLVPPPSEAIGNETPSLCDDDAQRKIRQGTLGLNGAKVPPAVVLTTDGVPNSFEKQSGFFQFCESLPPRAAAASSGFNDDLGRWLREISRKGSGDDATVALAWPVQKPEAAPKAKSAPTPETKLEPRSAPEQDLQPHKDVREDEPVGLQAPDDVAAGSTWTPPLPPFLDGVDEAYQTSPASSEESASRHARQEPDPAEPGNPLGMPPGEAESKEGDRGAADRGTSQL